MTEMLLSERRENLGPTSARQTQLAGGLTDVFPGSRRTGLWFSSSTEASDSTRVRFHHDRAAIF